MTTTPVAAEEIRAWLTGQIAGILGQPEDDIDPNATFDSFGLASRDAVSLSGDLEDYLNRRLSPTLLYQYSTINALAGHLAWAEPRPDMESGSVPAGKAAAPPSEAAVAAMTEEEAEAALLQKLLDLDA